MCNLHIIYKLGGKNLTKNDYNVLFKLLSRSSEINDDGFGIFDSNGIVYKKGDKFSNSFREEIALAYKKPTNFLLGHNRFATSGKVSDDNSHPFHNDRIVWSHNGIVNNTLELKEKYGECDVDSQYIGSVIMSKLDSCINMESAIKDTVKELKGSFSVFVYDKREKTLYYFKNSGSDFEIQLIRKGNSYYVIGTTNEKKLYWLFTKSMYGFVINDYEPIATFNLEDDKLYRIDSDGMEKLCDLEFEATEKYCNGRYYSSSYSSDKDIDENEDIAFELETELRHYFKDNYIDVRATKKGNFIIEEVTDDKIKGEIQEMLRYHNLSKNNVQNMVFDRDTLDELLSDLIELKYDDKEEKEDKDKSWDYDTPTYMGYPYGQ